MIRDKRGIAHEVRIEKTFHHEVALEANLEIERLRAELQQARDTALTLDEVRALLDANIAREASVQAQAVPGAPWDSSWYRTPQLQSALDKLAAQLDI